jgi:hypothetical protein
MLRRVALVRTDVSEESSASLIRLTKIGELGTTLAVTSNRRTLRRITEKGSVIKKCQIENAKRKGCDVVAAVLTRATRRNIPEDILHSHHRENLKSQIFKNFPRFCKTRRFITMFIRTLLGYQVY